MTPTQSGGAASPSLPVALVALVALTLGAPLVWSFAFAGLGALTWLVAAFGWLPGGWFVSNLSLLGTVAAAITAPVVAWALYRILPRVVAVERELATQRSFAPTVGSQAAKPPAAASPR
jgi:hypothetical protein